MRDVILFAVVAAAGMVVILLIALAARSLFGPVNAVFPDWLPAATYQSAAPAPTQQAAAA